jgi:hypothetical protein
MQRVLQVQSTATIAGMKKLKLMLFFFATLLVESSYADLQLNLVELPSGLHFGIPYCHQGALLVSDDQANVIYRISFTK